VAVVYPNVRLDLVEALRPDLVVYHAVDDYTRGNDGDEDRAFVAWEAGMRGVADLAVAVSPPLEERLRKVGFREVRYLPLGYDESFDSFRPGTPPEDIASLPRPILGFAGTVRAERMDISLIRDLAKALPSATLAFVGTEFEDTRGSLASLRSLPNVRFLGFKERAQVPAYVAAFDACIVPYRDSQLNRHCFPLKVVDALALGRPVVLVPPRPDIEEFRGVVRFASDTAGFLRAIEEIVAGPDSREERAARREAVAGLSWDRLTGRLERMLDEHLRSRLRGPS
jgi:glycosyltransferase involved in cell wall biosynthesis